jgi:hypothetical protein
MLTAAQLIEKIRSSGGTIRINDSGDPVVKTSLELMEQLRATRAEVLGQLADECNSTFDLDLDFETRSAFDLGKGGAHAYAMHPSTILLCAAIAIRGRKPRLWFPGDPVPWEIRKVRRICAHNAIFEFLIIEHVASRLYGWPKISLEKFHCTLAKGRVAALPGKLERACEGLGI